MINKNFTLLWSGQIVSQLGDKLYAIALAWWILQKTNSPSVMGLFLLVSVLPGILLGLLAGALTDRWRRQTMLVVTDLVRGALVLAIAYLSFRGALQVGTVFIIGSALSITTAFFDPAMQALIPEIVAPERLPRANGLSNMIGGICTVVGPLCGALAVSVVGLTWVFLANSLSYFGAALLACFITVRRGARDSARRENLWREMRQGFAFIKRHRPLSAVLEIIAVAHFFIGSLAVTLPFLAKALSGSGVRNLGYLEMTIGAGLIAGSTLLGMRKNCSINLRRLIGLVAALGICFALIAAAQFLKVSTVYAYMLIIVVLGACLSSASVFWETLLQNYTPPNMTGRVFSVSTLLGNTSLPVAYGVFGVLLNLSSIPVIMGACGASLIVLSGYQLCRYFPAGMNDSQRSL